MKLVRVSSGINGVVIVSGLRIAKLLVTKVRGQETRVKVVFLVEIGGLPTFPTIEILLTSLTSLSITFLANFTTPSTIKTKVFIFSFASLNFSLEYT